MAEETQEKTVQKFSQDGESPVQFGQAKEGGLVNLSGHKDFASKMKEVTGVKDFDLAAQILAYGSSAIIPLIGDNHSESVNAVLQSLNDMKPKDSYEARLIAQANALYLHGMNCLGNAAMSFEPEHDAYYTNKAVKLLRLHNETVETLNRYRRGGKQEVTVTHAVVAGQAVVNNFHGAGVVKENRGESPCS